MITKNQKRVALCIGVHKILILLLLLAGGAASGQEHTAYTIIPAPVKLNAGNGSYQFDRYTPVQLIGFAAKNNLENFAKKIFHSAAVQKVNQKPPLKAGRGLILVLDPKLPLPEEGYRLTINSAGIRITAQTERGAFYGLQTLLQLMPDTIAKGSGRLPFVRIEDYPRYAYRGLHLDVGRHLFPVSFIKEYIDLIAQYKLNTFHWHLTEDQGWRIEIKKYPKLTQVGGFRAQTLIGHHRSGPQVYDGIPYGGFYTQNEIREVIAYAKSRYVTVVPEIEMPGHSVAALSAYPELACGKEPGPFKARENWGIADDVYCAGKEETFKMLEDILDEVLELFPSAYIHIGGDECPKTKWKTCQFCQERIKNEKLKDEHELQSYFIQRIEKYLNSKGRKIIGWDEILEGGLAPNATVMSWRGIKGGIAAAQQHHNVIMTPGSHLYFDHQESKSKQEPLNIGSFLPLEKVYSYNPSPVELKAEQQQFVLGVQANMWTEYMPTTDKVRYMLYPRLFALSEIAWTPLERKNWEQFSENSVSRHLSKLDAEGIMFRVPVPIGAQDTTISASKFTLNYKTPVKHAKIFYTLNGFEPCAVDQLYTGPVALKVPPGEERTVKCVVITPSGKRSVVTTTIIKGLPAQKEILPVINE